MIVDGAAEEIGRAAVMAVTGATGREVAGAVCQLLGDVIFTAFHYPNVIT